MDPAIAHVPTHDAFLFQDGLGERRQVLDQTTNETLEMLCLRGELTAVPSFEFALRERVSRLANFRHAYYGRVRRVDRLSDHASTLAIVSECTAGARLSEILAVAEQRRLALDINVALCLIRQLVPAVAMLHQNARDVSHGALGPERVVVTPHARLVIVDYVLGAALEQLRYSHERYWKEFRIALPRSAGLPRFDHRADVTQLGIVALSLILGRPLKDDEYPGRIAEVVTSASAMSALGGHEPITPTLRSWLTRALQLDLRNSFTSALEAQAAFDEVLSDDGYIAAPVALETFLARYHACAEMPAASPDPAPVPAGSPYASYLTDLIRPAQPSPEPVRSQASEPVRPQPIVETVRIEPARQAPPAVAVRPQPRVEPAYQPAPPEAWPIQSSARQAHVAPVGISPVVSAPVPVEVAPVSEPITQHPQPKSDVVRAASRASNIPANPPSASPAIFQPAIQTERNISDVPDIPDERDAVPARNWGRLVAAAAVLVALAGGGLLASRYYGSSATIGASVGTLVVESNPPGAQVIIDNEPRGMTPLNLTLTAGPHVLELRGAGDPRVIPLNVPAGSQISHYIELPKTGPLPGQLQVRTDPPGARVTIDGQPHGTSPVTLADLLPGDHEILLESDLGSVRQHVTIAPGTTASLVVPLAAPADAPLSGWVSVSTPVEVQLFEGGRLIGTSQSDRIMVSAGRHEIELVNDTLGYRGTRTVQVPPGRVASFAIELPKGTIALNAIPWAEVWIDGDRVGETPIGNLSIPIGPHEVMFRNPELGEQRHAITVTAAAPARLSVDLRKK